MRFKGGPKDKEYRKKVRGDETKKESSLMRNLKSHLRVKPNFILTSSKH